ncbi:MAG: MBL fold metallo-hydrolase, partial [Actinobacteria bacterium]|nr:MBL fold metallo-hydrolase [Actinomycetota bacterium]
MRFTVLSHAGLLVETPDCTLVSDPWLVGSCYWRSWWNYPPPPVQIVDGLQPDFIYITHLHWDHFHGVSLRRFDPDTPVLVPHAHFTRMVDDLRYLGFSDIREMKHGCTRRLGPSTSVTSYLFGHNLDSALVVDDGESVLLNVNDCKIGGATLRQLLKANPRIDFVLRSHSNASAYPFCVSSEHPEHLSYRAKEDYAKEFLAFSESVRARYAVPFASNHCFLHRETVEFNDTIVSPYEVKSYFDDHRVSSSECMVMAPGSTWAPDKGFAVIGQDYFTDREGHLEEMWSARSAKLSDYYSFEDSVAPDWDGFKRYFEEFLAALPKVFRILFPARVIFRVSGAGDAAWIVDFRRATVVDLSDHAPSGAADADVYVDVHANVLRDCCRKRMFSVFNASKRVRYHLATRSGLRHFLFLCVALDLYESEYFPLRLTMRRRFLGTWLRRWREVGTYASMAWGLAIGRGVRSLDPSRLRGA